MEMSFSPQLIICGFPEKENLEVISYETVWQVTGLVTRGCCNDVGSPDQAVCGKTNNVCLLRRWRRCGINLRRSHCHLKQYLVLRSWSVGQCAQPDVVEVHN